MTTDCLKQEYKAHRESSLFGRYINSDHIKNVLEKHRFHFDVSILGKSVLGESIHFIKLGSGQKRILMWSQMHGNETTTTKAVFDLLNVFSASSNEEVANLLRACTIGIIPMLNPDGSRAYTRLNANQVDLNRDAQHLSQPESQILRRCFENFKPDFCFNLHGQRTIFSAGLTNNPATVSFLSPAQDVMCSVTDTRKKAMAIIVKMNQNLQAQIPNQVGIYDDAFNLNCVGDTFQSLNVPTILFEAGHFKSDYNREVVRELIFQSLWVGLSHVVVDEVFHGYDKFYFEIPPNEKLFYDIIIRNVKLEREGVYQISDIAMQYEEKLNQDQIQFIPRIEKISNLSGFFGHKEFIAHNQLIILPENTTLIEGVAIDFVWVNGEKKTLCV